MIELEELAGITLKFPAANIAIQTLHSKALPIKCAMIVKSSEMRHWLL